MKIISVDATLDKLEEVLDFVADYAKDAGFNGIPLNRVRVATEEIIVNIISYAYPGGTGTLEVCCERQNDPAGLSIRIQDSGVEFNPLSIIPPDTLNLPIEQRPVGGLGIHLVCTIMDRLYYRRINGKNELTMVKYL